MSPSADNAARTVRCVPLEGIRAEANRLAVSEGKDLAALFATDEREGHGSFVLRYVFTDRASGTAETLEVAVPPDPGTFPSIAATVHAASGCEREIQDLFGLRPEGHPDPKRLVHHAHWPEGEYPLRRDVPLGRKPPRAGADAGLGRRFARVEGEGVFEIPVGPVHAGIIEPGHFRFSVAGEPVANLEAQLWFVHRGIEKLAEGMAPERGLFLAERISGDETLANSLAYCEAAERIAGVEAPPRARYGRVLFAELERVTSHLGDLAGICLDTAYGFVGFQFRLMRGWAYLMADELCGQRFLRSVNRIGGLRKDFAAGKEASLLGQIARLKKELLDTQAILRANPMFVDRVENTGVLPLSVARDLHATGPAGRASGVRYDVRKAFPYAAYGSLDFAVSEHNNGDVNCRMNMKIEECLASLDLMACVLGTQPDGPVLAPALSSVGTLPAWGSDFGLVEAPRGEAYLYLMTDAAGNLFRMKPRTPSFFLWPALTHAVRGNVVPDFPLINKSFNLSYAGNDL